MKDQVLSIEKMLKLKDLGVDTSIASMYWEMPTSDNDFKDRLHIKGKYGNLKANDDGMRIIGAFTLQDILDILPREIVVNYDFTEIGYKQGKFASTYELQITKDKIKWYMFYNNTNIEIGERLDYLKVFSNELCLEVAYQMLLWCIENGYFKTKEK